MEDSAVLTVACVNEDHRQIGLQTFIQHGGQLLMYCCFWAASSGWVNTST